MSEVLERFEVGDLGTNCYIFGDNETGEVAIVDPGFEGKRIYDFIKENNYIVKYIILTHGHFDHIGGVKYLKQLTGAEILIHELDGEKLIDPQQNFSAFVGLPDSHAVQVKADRYIEDNEQLMIGNKSFKIIHTPGHSEGSICIIFGNNILSGDTLFRESIGRTDLPGANHTQILDSLDKLINLNDNLKVYPGHGETSFIQHEKKYNPFVK